MSATENAALARRIYEHFNNKEFDRAVDLATDDVEVVFVPAGQTFRGREGFAQFMRGFAGAFPDGKVKVQNQVATDDHVVTEFGFAGTHTGTLATPAGEIPPTGRSVDLVACEVWKIRDGRLARLVNYQDVGTMLRQLGVSS